MFKDLTTLKDLTQKQKLVGLGILALLLLGLVVAGYLVQQVTRPRPEAQAGGVVLTLREIEDPSNPDGVKTVGIYATPQVDAVIAAMETFVMYTEGQVEVLDNELNQSDDVPFNQWFYAFKQHDTVNKAVQFTALTIDSSTHFTYDDYQGQEVKFASFKVRLLTDEPTTLRFGTTEQEDPVNTSAGNLNGDLVPVDASSTLTLPQPTVTPTLPAEGLATLSLQPSSGTYNVGDSFPVDIVLNTGEYHTDSVDVVLYYDTDALTATEVLTESGVFSSYSSPGDTGEYIDDATGKIQIGGQIAQTGSDPGVFGSDELFATVTFRADAPVDPARVWFEFTGENQPNDTNVSRCDMQPDPSNPGQEICVGGTGEDILGQVVDASFIVTVGPTPTPGPTSTPTPVPPTPTPTPTPIPSPPPPTPTPTPTSIPEATPTPTPVPVPVYFNLGIRLQGREYTGTHERNLRLKIQALNTDQDLYTNDQLRTTQNGTLPNDVLLSGVAPGNYEILVKPEGFLQKKFTQVLVEGTNTLTATADPLLGGDLDGSGRINSLDYSIFLNHYKSDHEPSDLDGSGQVNSLDFSIMLSNWNETGDEEGY